MQIQLLMDVTHPDRVEKRNDESDNAQVIYVCDAGDYCRETAPRDISTHEQACEWAQTHFNKIADRHARAAVTGFRIEWF